MINKIDGYFEQKNGNKYVCVPNFVRNNKVLKKYNQVFNEIKYHFKKIDDSDEEYDKDFMKIRFSSDDDDDVSFNKMLYFPTITVIIRCVFEQNGKYFQQVYLDECLYQV